MGQWESRADIITTLKEAKVEVQRQTPNVRGLHDTIRTLTRLIMKLAVITAREII